LYREYLRAGLSSPRAGLHIPGRNIPWLDFLSTALDATDNLALRQLARPGDFSSM